MELLHILGYIAAFATGLLLGLVGGGGALISIPALVYLFGIPPSVATGYSLFLVAISASSGAIQNIRKKLVDYNAALYYGIPSVITVYLMRRLVMPNLPEVFVTVGNFTLTKNLFILTILSVVMIGAGYKMLTDSGPHVTADQHKDQRFMLVVYAVLIGSFLGLVGAGGGFLIVPALIYLTNVSTKKAIGTSLVLVAVNSFIGFMGDVHSNSNMDWGFMLLFSSFSVAGVFAGTYLSNFIEGAKLKKYLGWFILTVAAYIITREFIMS